MNNKIQTQGRSPLAILQQKERDDTRLFFRKGIIPFFLRLRTNSQQPRQSLNLKILIKTLLVAFTILETTYCFSQVTLGTIKEVTPQIVAKPLPYDSLQDFKFQDDANNYNQYVGLQVYFPPLPGNGGFDEYGAFNLTVFLSPKDTVIADKRIQKWSGFERNGYYDNIRTCVKHPEAFVGGNTVEIGSNNAIVGNKYYTILDIIHDTENNKSLFNSLISRLNLSKSENTFVDDKQLKTYAREEKPVLIVLRDNSSGDTLYYPSTKKFIVVPYFTKMKYLYEGKNFVSTDWLHTTDINTKAEIKIEPKDKWMCEEVTLLQDNQVNQGKSKYYSLYFILRNSNGNKVVLGTMKSFISEIDYLEEEKRKKLQQAELIAAQSKLKKEKLEKERATKEKHRLDCISKFGADNGTLIADGKVSLGMTKEMCKAAWDEPYDVYKTTNEHGSYETWYYGWRHVLHFANGVLKEIEE